MQQSLEFFCEECGAANPGSATHCFACQSPLTPPSAAQPVSAPPQPVTIVSTPALQVTAGAADSSAVLSDTLAPGTLLQKRYRIEREIGRGGYSIVYRARDTSRHGRVVTIKQINLRNLSSREIIEATETFNRETTLLPGLKHEGIPRFYGHFTDPEHWYLVMEYIHGQTLEDYLHNPAQKGYASLSETLKIGIALCRIMEYLHFFNPPVVFRDVKPANIMLTRKGRIYLIDFGIARSFNPSKTRDTTPLGSPGFAAPEQYGRAQSDPRTDIYGLGATLQTLLTGCDPLDLRQGVPSRAPHPIPPDLQALLDSMMDPDPNRRPQNLGVVRQKLQHILARARQVYRYFVGVGLATAFFAWGGLTSLLVYSVAFSTLAALSGCLWGLTAIVGLIFLLIFLMTPSERPIALGMLTVVAVVIVLLSAHIINLAPYIGY